MNRGTSGIVCSLGPAILFFMKARDLRLINGTLRWVGRHGFLAIHDLPDDLSIREILGEFLRTHAEGSEGGETRPKRTVFDLLGAELQINPLVDSHGLDLLNVPGTRAEGQAIERMHRAPMFAGAGGG